MKLALLITLIATAAMVGILFVLPSTTREEPKLDRASDPGTTKVVTPLGGQLDFRALKGGKDIYRPQIAETTLDGETRQYASLLLWFGEWQTQDDHTFEVRNVRGVVNREPRTLADVERLVTIPSEMSPAQIGEELARLMGTSATGFRASRAVFHGGKEVGTADKVELLDDMELFFVDEKAPGQATRLWGRSLILYVENGKLARAVSADPVDVSGFQGEFRGQGFVFDPKSGRIEIQKNIAGTLKDLNLIGRKGEPVQISAAGPLHFVSDAPFESGSPVEPSGTFHLNGPIEIRQATAILRGQKAIVVMGGTPRKIERFEMEGAVVAEMPEGTFIGQKVVYEAREVGKARIVVSGDPVRAKWLNGAGVLPGARKDADLEVITMGTVTFEGVDAPDDELRKVELLPEVVITDTETLVTANVLRLFLKTVPKNTEGAKPGETTTFPARVELEGPIDGLGPRGRFGGQRLIFVRGFDASGGATTDDIELIGPGYLTQYLEEVPASGPGKKAPLWSGATLDIRADELIALRRDHLRIQPLDARGRGNVIVKLLDPKTPDGAPKAEVNGQTLRLRLSEVWETTSSPLTASRKPKPKLESFVAEGAVSFAAPGYTKGAGDYLSYSADPGNFELIGQAGKRVTATIIDKRADPQILEAETILFDEAGLRLSTKGRTIADVRLPMLDTKMSANAPTVPTHIEADEFSLWLTEEGEGDAKKRVAREAQMSGKVLVTQGGDAKAICEYLWVDLIHRESIVRGSPARLDLNRTVEGVRVAEWVQGTSMTIGSELTTLIGPIHARFHAPATQMAMNLKSKPPSEGSKSPLVPFDVETDAELIVKKDIVELKGPAKVTQGDAAKDGFRVSGRKILLFLGPKDPAVVGSSMDVLIAIVEGEAKYDGPDLSASGDTVRFDRATKQIILWAESGDASLTMRSLGLVDYRRPGFRVNYANPDAPYFDSLDKPYGTGNK